MLIFCQPILEESLDLVSTHHAAFSQHDTGYGHLTEITIWTAHYGGFSDCLAFGKDTFDVSGIDVGGPYDNDILEPLIDIEVTLCISVPDISCAEPTVNECCPRRLWVHPIMR
jgi:hypothetical protein